MIRHMSQLRLTGRLLQVRAFASSQNASPPTDGKSDPVPIIDFEDPDYIPLPVYPDKINETLEKRKQRLIYQSRKRGMLENDLLLSTFAAKYLATMDAQQTALYDKLINGPTNDWDIYYWATGAKPTPEMYDNEIMRLFKEHVSNNNKEQRLRQPDLL